ncbi:MAG: cell division protein ZipA C-terminal FtsZ-binding domain-containing protein [Gammaproteobacteria bacterium]|nr:cell division protein ZipA C-terminal FtsZ-binding domain-containing protein [Gammaproteobacteria bacterium]
MEPLRWVLLAAGIVFVIIIYVLGRNRRRRNHSAIDELIEDDLPAFSARSLDDVDEGVGEVRIVSGSSLDADADLDVNVSGQPEPAVGSSQADTDNNSINDIIVLYILPKADQVLHGAQINSSAQAMGLIFGEMNIFHYKNEGRNVFSLANMLEPGSFNPDTIHELKTSGLTVFMQIQKGDPRDDLTEMLQRSYQLAGLLDARICNHRRKPLTEQDAENYRSKVSAFLSRAVPDFSSET